MVEEILCDAPHNSKIVNDEIIFVPSKAMKAEHTKRYVSISASEDWCKKNSSERFYRIRKEKRLMFFNAILVPRTTARSGSSAIWKGIPVFLERRRSSPLISAPPPAR